MNAQAVLGWGLAVAAVAAGYAGWGWRGVVLAVTVIVFWLLLQFSRALRVMRDASGRPVGHVTSAVMLNSKLGRGMRLAQVMALTGSFGQRLGEPEGTIERFAWRDEGGDEVRVQLDDGRLVHWELVRAGS
jgi:hypothetical protein